MGKYIPSQPDDIALCAAVEQRFLDVCGSFLRIKGEELVPPSGLNAEILLWRTMRLRFKDRKLFHTDDEMRALRLIAQWTCDVNARIRNQPQAKVEWNS